MNIVSLQTFIAIVETGSLVRASQRLHVTQSTVTARLKTLEDELGQRLLNRHKSGTTLTPAGTKLLRYARVMTGLWRQAKYETALPEGLSSVCTFGCDRELWHGPGRAFFNGVVSGHPEMAVSVMQGGARDLETWLAEGMVDVILTYDATLPSAAPVAISGDSTKIVTFTVTDSVALSEQVLSSDPISLEPPANRGGATVGALRREQCGRGHGAKQARLDCALDGLVEGLVDSRADEARHLAPHARHELEVPEREEC